MMDLNRTFALHHLDGNHLPDGLTVNEDFNIQARVIGQEQESAWVPVTAITAKVAAANTTQEQFDTHPIAVASFKILRGTSIELKISYNLAEVKSATVRPVSLGKRTAIDDGIIGFTLDCSGDVMLEINHNKWQALHLLVNEIDTEEPTCDMPGLWYFGAGINKGRAYDRVVDGKLAVPSNTTIYLASGAFITAQIIFTNVENSGIRGSGYIFRDTYVASASSRPRELDGGSILIEHSKHILVEGVTSLRSYGFSLPILESRDVHVNRYRSFSGYSNGDGIDLFCCRDVMIEKCFLRNSDDTIAIYGHRWGYYGDTQNIRIQNCTLLPDIAHPIQIGTHGNPEQPESLSNIHIRDIDILDHCESQLWYQGCISINAGDENLIQDVLVENVRIEKITKGQLFNIRVMKNAMWTTAPGRWVRNVTLRNIELDTNSSGTVNPSQVLGYDCNRGVENVTIENLKIGGKYIHDGMAKPRWYMVSDFVPLFANEHAKNITIKLNKDELNYT